MNSKQFKENNNEELIDLEAIRVKFHDDQTPVIQHPLVTVSVRKPTKEEWVRVRPGEDYSICVGLIELKLDQEMYLVLPELISSLTTEATFSKRMLLSTMTRHGTFFLWPVRLPDMEGKLDTWNKSALEAAKCAQENWCRITANMALGAYDVKTISAQVAEPAWPEESFQALISIAFQDRIIKSIDHPVLQRLRGEI